MISNSLAMKVLNAALATGGDYAEIYLEDGIRSSITLENGKVESYGEPQSYGAGIRILKGLQSVYGYTSDLSPKSLVSLASTLASSYEGERAIEVTSVQKQRIKTVSKIRTHLHEVPAEKKVAYLKEGYEAAKIDPRIVRIQNVFLNDYKDIEIYSAEGPVAKKWNTSEEHGRVLTMAMAFENGDIQMGMGRKGHYGDWEYFNKSVDYKAASRTAAEKAIAMLSAKECPSGTFPVIITNGWGGVLFHEACGHPLEATATAKGLSVFSDSIGKQIASPIVSAFDDGSIPNEWGSSSIDSEGHPTQKNALIKDGICVGFLVDKANGRRLNMPSTGSARRQSYRFEPTSRMNNTYIAAGKDNPEDIIKDTKLGIYVADFGGGSVNPATGDFNFSASEAYIVRDGKIAEMVKGCTLIGSGREVLMNIDRVGNDLDLSEGNCGSISGMVPVDVGQPTLRLKQITVGGRGGKLE